MLGHCSYFTIANFVKLLKAKIPGLEITVANPFNPGGNALSDKQLEVFDRVISLPKKRNINIKSSDRMAALRNILKYKLERRNIFFNLVSLRFRKIKYYINAEAENIVFGNIMKKIFAEYDIFHFHYASPYFLSPMKFVPNGKVKIISIWGSDLFQVSGAENYRLQLEAFNTADLIICNTIEKREIFLSKFGRHLTSKIRIANFGLPEEKFQKIKLCNNSESRIRFRKKMGISPGKFIVVVGYNSSPKQNHVVILNYISRIAADIKDRIHLIIPMTYGTKKGEENYASEVKSICEKTGCSFTIFEDYLSEDEYFEFNSSTDIRINLRETDSMNTAMLESIAGESIMINGVWHPYGILRRLGIYYFEIEKISELENLIPYLIKNIEAEKVKVKSNPEFLREYFSSERTSNDWEEIYCEAGKILQSR